MKSAYAVGRALLLAVAILTPLDSGASDDYPGISCSQTSGGTYSIFGGTVANSSSTSELNIICPLVKQDNVNYVGANVNVFDRHTTLNVSCTFVGEQVTFPGGTSVILDAETQVTSGSGAASKALSFGPANGNYRYITCSIPRTQNGNVSHVVQTRHAY